MSESLRVIRRQTGNFLEDFRPGQVFRHKGGKTVTEGLFATFTEFAMTANPLAKNAHYARAYGYDGLVCPPGLAMLVAFSQTVEDVSENARANLEYIDMRFGAPVYVGDTIEVETKVLNVRPSSSRPNLGIVHVQSTARKNVGAERRGRGHDLAAQGPGLQARHGRGAPRRRGRARRGRLRAVAARLRPRRRATRRAPTSRARTATSRTSSPAR